MAVDSARKDHRPKPAPKPKMVNFRGHEVRAFQRHGAVTLIRPMSPQPVPTGWGYEWRPNWSKCVVRDGVEQWRPSYVLGEDAFSVSDYPGLGNACRFGQVGEVYHVREAFAVHYAADQEAGSPSVGEMGWRSAADMPSPVCRYRARVESLMIDRRDGLFCWVAEFVAVV